MTEKIEAYVRILRSELAKHKDRRAKEERHISRIENKLLDPEKALRSELREGSLRAQKIFGSAEAAAAVVPPFNRKNKLKPKAKELEGEETKEKIGHKKTSEEISEEKSNEETTEEKSFLGWLIS